MKAYFARSNGFTRSVHFCDLFFLRPCSTFSYPQSEAVPQIASSLQRRDISHDSAGIVGKPGERDVNLPPLFPVVLISQRAG